MNSFGEKNRPGAVVIGGDYQGLGIVRSLGAHGIPVFILDDEYSISRFSRYATGSVRVPDLRREDTTVEALLRLASEYKLHQWVLFPTRDELLATLSRNREILSKYFRVPAQDWETIRLVWDKRNTYRLANDLGIPIPKTWLPPAFEHLNKIEFDFPVAIKPAIKEHFFYVTKAKAWQANSPSELQNLFKRATQFVNPAELLVQEIVPGSGAQQLAYCAFFKEGRAIGKMTVRRTRQHPPDFGRASTYVETIEMPEVEELAERFLRSINYYGLVEVEFKQDPRDGQLKLLDVNGRTWGYHSLGRAAGVDFPYLLYRDQMCESLEPACGRPGMSWLRLATDAPTSMLEILRGRMKFRDYIRSLCRVDESAVFSYRDPLPGIVECALLPYLLVRRGL
jgi:predicted ATP-grasp superfamily ATP-dependent carboligase